MDLDFLDRSELNKIALEAQYIPELDTKTILWHNFVEKTYISILDHCLSEAKKGRMDTIYSLYAAINCLCGGGKIFTTDALYRARVNLFKAIVTRLKDKNLDCSCTNTEYNKLYLSWS